MINLYLSLSLAGFLCFGLLVSSAFAATDPCDVITLQDLYRSFNCPPEMVGWKLNGGDPCQDSWEGVTCNGSSGVNIKLTGLGLDGRLGGQLNLLNLKQLDLSEIPDLLPSNATHIDLSCNNLSSTLPYSITSMKHLRHLNLSHNSLTGPIGNVFTGLQNLKQMGNTFEFGADYPRNFTQITIPTDQKSNTIEKFISHAAAEHKKRFGAAGIAFVVCRVTLLILTVLSTVDSHPFPTPPARYPESSGSGHPHSIRMPTFFGKLVPWLKIVGPWKLLLGSFIYNAFLLFASLTGAFFTFKIPPFVHLLMAAIGVYIILLKFVVSPHPTPKPLGAINAVCLCLAGGFTAYSGSLKRKSHKLSIVAFSFSLCAFLCFLVELVIQLRRLKIKTNMNNAILPSVRRGTADNLGQGITNSSSRRGRTMMSAKSYSILEMESATRNFNHTNFIGKGSLGSVFRAEFPNGQILAVKYINTAALSILQEDQFLNVVFNIERLKHPNITNLIGYCTENGNHILVYEYIGNLSLESAIHYNVPRCFNWYVRIRIAHAVARALDYVHSVPMAHRNIKAANILLDDELKPHLCDSGLEVLRPLTSNRLKLKSTISCTGYYAPENNKPGTDKLKSDIYAFGVLLLELLTGRKPFDSSKPIQEQSLVKWIAPHLNNANSLEAMADPNCKIMNNYRSLSIFGRIASQCIQTEPELRPPMSDVLRSFEYLNSSLRRDGLNY